MINGKVACVILSDSRKSHFLYNWKCSGENSTTKIILLQNLYIFDNGRINFRYNLVLHKCLI